MLKSILFCAFCTRGVKMIELSKREWGIVQYLLTQEEAVSVEKLSLTFGVSVRTIRYDLENIEYFLKKLDIALLKKAEPAYGLRINFLQ